MQQLQRLTTARACMTSPRSQGCATHGLQQPRALPRPRKYGDVECQPGFNKVRNARAATTACVLHRIETQLNLRKNMPKQINQKTSKRSSEMASQKCATRELQQLRAPQHLRNAKVTMNTRAATAAHVEPPAQAAWPQRKTKHTNNTKKKPLCWIPPAAAE